MVCAAHTEFGANLRILNKMRNIPSHTSVYHAERIWGCGCVFVCSGLDPLTWILDLHLYGLVYTCMFRSGPPDQNPWSTPVWFGLPLTRILDLHLYVQVWALDHNPGSAPVCLGLDPLTRILDLFLPVCLGLRSLTQNPGFVPAPACSV